MNITLRKLSLLEKRLMEKDLREKANNYSSNPIDENTRICVTQLMDKIRDLNL